MSPFCFVPDLLRVSPIFRKSLVFARSVLPLLVVDPCFSLAPAFFNSIDKFRPFALMASSDLMALILRFWLAAVAWVISILLVIPNHTLDDSGFLSSSDSVLSLDSNRLLFCRPPPLFLLAAQDVVNLDSAHLITTVCFCPLSRDNVSSWLLLESGLEYDTSRCIQSFFFGLTSAGSGSS